MGVENNNDISPELLSEHEDAERMEMAMELFNRVFSVLFGW